MRFSRCLACALGVALLPSAGVRIAAAQRSSRAAAPAIPPGDTLPVALGARVRVAAHLVSCLRAQVVTGTLLSTAGDLVVVAPPQGRDTLAFPLRAVRRLDVSAGSRLARRMSWQNVGIGAAAGAIGAVLYRSLPCRLGTPCGITGQDLVIGVAAGGAVGGLVGFARHTEAWRRVPLPAHVTFAPDCPRRLQSPTPSGEPPQAP